LDWGTLLFTLCLIVASGWAILIVSRTFSDNRQAENWRRAKHQEAAHAARRMERRRSRVWFRIDNLHAEFMGKSVLAERVAEITTAPAEPPSVGNKELVDAPDALSNEAAGTPDSFSQSSLRDAFETFLRQNR